MLPTVTVLLAAGLLVAACGSATGPASAASAGIAPRGDAGASGGTTIVSGMPPSDSTATLAPDQTIHVRSPYVAVATTSGVWVSSDKAVIHIDPTTGATDAIATPIAAGAASGLAASPRVLWEADFDTGAVDEIDVVARHVAAAISVGNGPRGVVIEGATPWVFEEWITLAMRASAGSAPRSLSCDWDARLARSWVAGT